MTVSIEGARRRSRPSARVFALSLVLIGGAAQAGFPMPTPAPLATPNVRVWTSGIVNAIERDAAGGLIVGGIFHEVNGVPRRNLARLLPDGTLDPDFTPNPDSGVQDIAIGGDGAIYVAGSFGVIGGQAHARLARLQPGGAVDAGWTPSVDSSPRAIVAGDDEVFIGGFFTLVNGQPRERLARVSTSGAGLLDTDWTPTSSSSVDAMAYDASDDSLFIGGDFVAINNATRMRIAKLDASGIGALRPWDAPAGSRVQAIELDGLGSLYVMGGFTVIGANGAPRQYVARLSTTSGDADAFSLAFPAGTNGGVSAMDLDAGALYLAGSFTHVNGIARRHAAKISTADASLDLAFAPELAEPAFLVFSPATDAVYVSGSATRHVNGDTRVGVAVVDEDTGATLAPLDIVIPGTVYAMVALPGGGQIIGGDFYRVGELPRENLAKLHPDGTVDADWVPVVDDRVIALATDAGGTMLYAAGVFHAAGAVPRNALAKFAVAGAGALQPWDAGVAPDAALQPVRALAVDLGGDVYAGGNFQEIGGQVRSSLAKLSSADASIVAGWGSGANGQVTSLAVAPEGSLYASGAFTQINGQNRARLAKLDPLSGAVDLAFTAQLGDQQAVMSWGFAGAALYVSGSFTTIGDEPRNHVARLEAATGAVDPAWAPTANTSVYNVLPSGDAVYLAGNFSSVNGVQRIQLAKISATTGALDPAWDPQAYDGPLLAAVLDPAGNVVVAGGFRQIGTHLRHGLAAIPPAPSVALLPHIFGDGFEE